LIVELPVGSYVPSFREPSPHSLPPAELQVIEAVEAPSLNQVHSQVLPTESQKVRGFPVIYRWILILVSLLVATLLGFGVGRLRSNRAENTSTPTNMSRFWEPITSTSSRITYCLGVPTDAVDLQSRTIPAIPAGETASLNVYDVITLARSIAPLVPKNGEFRVLAASETGFAQLREGPSVMIGAFDNPWTMRITQDLPIGFEYDNHVRKVVDRKSVPKGVWTLEWQLPATSRGRDYAVVARIHDQVSGQPVIILAGILGEGTEAASEVVSNPAYLNAMLSKAPKNWDQLNLEAVIEANVIEGHPGPPTVVAVETW
jgi:hypothetical protein